jgi:hypothetical protein
MASLKQPARIAQGKTGPPPKKLASGKFSCDNGIVAHGNAPPAISRGAGHKIAP